ncbi:MAG: tRNA 2-selenouridine(34) synthase MnmH [Bacteroidetes bacterium]|nr:tRNA 2-selenouridine(34) synthase MnmH [Bacteroidota bacterium]
MIIDINIEEYLELKVEIPLIDVRSPSEFSKGHIPEATNIPIFSDDERAHIGTIFTKQSKENALVLGYKYANSKLTYFIAKSLETAPQKKVALYCWRGGMRSHKFAELLDLNGFTEIYVIRKGYKAFRNHALDSFNKNVRLNIIGGYTGSGKTHILNILKSSGLQIIDLEAIANHKGSVFGGIGAKRQPTTEQFENNLFRQWKKLDFSRTIWIEDESFSIGSVNMPLALYKKIITSPVIFMDIPKEERAYYLVSEYSGCETNSMITAIKKLSKRLGDLNTRKAIEHFENAKYFEVAMILLNYYDKSYKEGLSLREKEKVFTIKLPTTNHLRNAKIISEFAKTGNYY